MRALVFGEDRTLCSQVASALGSVPGLEVSVASRKERSGGVRVDLGDPATFSAFDRFDYVVSCASPVVRSPLPAIQYCAGRDLTFIQTISDVDTVERALLLRKRAQPGTIRGRVVVGLGVSPGLTNLVAGELAARHEGLKRLEVAVRVGGIRQSARGLFGSLLPPVGARYEQDERIEIPALASEVRIPFFDEAHDCALVAWPEGVMLHFSTGVPSTATYFASMAAPLMGVLGKLSIVVPYSPRFHRLASGLAAAAWPSGDSPVEITALGDRQGSLQCIGPKLSLRLTDSALGTAHAAAAGVRLLARRQDLKPNIYVPDELFRLGDFLDEMRASVAGRLAIELDDGGGPSMRS
jgi:hypothetical protein